MGIPDSSVNNLAREFKLLDVGNPVVSECLGVLQDLAVGNSALSLSTLQTYWRQETNFLGVKSWNTVGSPSSDLRQDRLGMCQ